MIFCDTSALAKYYVPEDASTDLRSWLDDEDAVIASELARVELMSVFHRRMRERDWTREQFQAATSQFNRNEAARFWTWVPVSSSIVDEASRLYMSLPESVFLRASDCLHIVTALHHGFDGLCTFDRHQLQAAKALGLAVLKP
ncbi:MAG TPA: type II toxin-antitoxin system VapC family toxin [Chthoniobacterales bacterium]|nr:type II toxin-antitoxin system VapC family toxin [Chthoniobacterales bacterium]